MGDKSRIDKVMAFCSRCLRDRPWRRIGSDIYQCGKCGKTARAGEMKIVPARNVWDELKQKNLFDAWDE